MRSSLTLATVLLVLAASVAGCIGGDGGEVKVPAPTAPATDGNNTTLGPVEAPSWQVGQWWAHHTYRGPDDKTGSHFNVVVIDDADGYTVASQSDKHAMMEAEEDVFDLGAFGTDLSTSWNGAAWKWYDWPLEHNKTWTQSLSIDGTTYDVEMRAEESEALRTAMGAKSGFKINGTSSDGALLVTYDFVTEMGWFSDFDLFDPADPTRTIYKVRNMGYGEGKTGDYVQIALVDVFDKTVPSLVAPSTDAFTVPEGTSLLMGNVTVRIEAGQATLTLTDASGGAHEYSTDAPGGEKAETVELKDPPTGEWGLTFLGLGPGASADVSLKAVVETVGTL